VSAGVTYPRGFRAAGISAGLKPSGRPDLGLVLGPFGTTCAGLFTTNRIGAAPVVLSRERLTSTDGAARAVLVNSGQANAATGPAGAVDAEKTTTAAADLLGLPAEQVLGCSTGVIGEPLHVEKLLAALPELARAASSEGGADFARAIMTTDTVPKMAVADAGPYRVGGCAKGVGMIAPDLATMLAFVTTDANVGAADLRRIAAERLEGRFESLSVDGCTSTNDTVLLFASGAASGEAVESDNERWDELAQAIDDVASSLVSQLIHDAEGGTHVVFVRVEGARSDGDARSVAEAVARSPLVQTAVFGADPNPGRILQAVGASGAEIDPGRVDVWIGDVQLARGGVIEPAYFRSEMLGEAARAAMSGPEVEVRVSLGTGDGRAVVLGSDLSYEYVRINGEYTT
jgi:glutamate N-acetyltransferase / amino-acid N-acetyltransferase